jgi:hypothetical protein
MLWHETGIIMLKGDMVEFTAPEIFSDAKREYKNPGIVMEVLNEDSFITGVSTSKAKVYWNDGKISVEHFCYLKKISVSLFWGEDD